MDKTISVCERYRKHCGLTPSYFARYVTDAAAALARPTGGGAVCAVRREDGGGEAPADAHRHAALRPRTGRAPLQRRHQLPTQPADALQRVSTAPQSRFEL